MFCVFCLFVVVCLFFCYINSKYNMSIMSDLNYFLLFIIYFFRGGGRGGGSLIYSLFLGGVFF